MQRRSQIGASDNIDLKDTWFAPDLEEDPRETPNHDPSIAPENNNKIITSSQSELHVQYIWDREGASEVHERPASKEVRSTSNLKKVSFAEQSSNASRGMPSREGEKGSKMAKMVDLSSTSIRRYASLSNKIEQTYGLFARL